MLLFHSRNIGLDNRRPVPLYGGLRMQGKIGEYEVGVLNITSQEKVFIQSDGARDVAPATNYSVVRAKRSILGRSDIGAMVTNRTNGDRAHDNKAVGFDTNLYFPRDIVFSGYYARTFTPDLAGSANSLFTSLGWSGSLVHGYINGLRIEKSFNPSMGFITRDDINRMIVHLGVGPRPRKWGIRQIRNEMTYRYTADQSFSLLDRFYTYSNTIETESSDRITSSVTRSFVYLPVKTKISGIDLPEGEYRATRYSTSIRTDRSRPISFSNSVRWGEYWNGRLRGLSGGVTLNLYNRLQTTVVNSYNDVELSGKQFSTNILSHSLTYSFTPDLFIRSITQWNNRDERVFLNILMRFTYLPGSDIYFVYNETYDAIEWAPGIRQRTALLKFTYLL